MPRRASAAVLLATGLAVGTVGVDDPVRSAWRAAPVTAAEVVGLTKGARGEPVRALQVALNRVGVGVKYGVDGYFGSATLASVKAFQRYKGLAVTGVVDAATAKALGFAAPAAPAAAPRRRPRRCPAPSRSAPAAPRCNSCSRPSRPPGFRPPAVSTASSVSAPARRC